jgi:hypothetical protein
MPPHVAVQVAALAVAVVDGESGVPAGGGWRWGVAAVQKQRGAEHRSRSSMGVTETAGRTQHDVAQ